MRPVSRKVLAACGLVVPFTFTALLLVAGLLRPGYSQASNIISDLGVGPGAIVGDVNFWLTGLLFVGFAIALRSGLAAESKTAVVAPALVVAGGVGIFLAGVFSDSPFPYPGDVHYVVSYAAFVAFTAAAFVTWNAQRADPGWGHFAKFSRIMGLLQAAMFLAFPLFPVHLVGVYQRLVWTTIFLWVGVTAAKLLAISSTSVDNPPPTSTYARAERIV